MNIKCLIGSKKNFLDFLDSISKEDNVAILTHNDLDGIASAIFLEEILVTKGIKIKFIDFLKYKKGMFDKSMISLKLKKISKIFLTDLGADTADEESFENLRNEFDVFLIDHHPLNSELRDKKNIIKTDSGDCVSFVVYELGEGLFDRKKWELLVCSAMISDMACKKDDSFKFIKKIYPEITKDNIFNSKPSELSKNITSGIIYFNDGLKKIYEIVKKGDYEKFKKYRKIIDLEIDKSLSNFEKKSEFYPDKGIYFYLFSSKFNINSIVSTILSLKNPDSTFIIFSYLNKNFIGVSARNQNKILDMNELMKKGIKGLDNATGGGHVPAAGARFMKKDLEKFKENILSQ